jgi:two-component system, chemotaxis family, sensor kinase CheA
VDLTTFYNQFRDETAENLRVLNEGLLALEGGLDEVTHKETIDAVFRAMHTIKGSARMLGLDPIGKIAHTCESILGAVREGNRTLNRPLIDDLLKGGDAILELITGVVEGKPTNVNAESLALTLGRNITPVVNTPTSTVAEPSSAEKIAEITANAPLRAETMRAGRQAIRQTIRVRVDRLDRLLNLAGELKIGTQVEASHMQALTNLNLLVQQQTKALLNLDRELKRLRFSPAQRMQFESHLHAALNTGEQARTTMRQALDRFDQHASLSSQIIEDVEQEVMGARLLPVSVLFSNLPRAARELTRELGKDVELVLQGETTELDRKAIESLGDPLTHILRNAIDHGIETPEERERSGKPRQGMITIQAQALGSYAQIRIQDDGRGMDARLLREAAVRKGLMSTEAVGLLTDQEALDLIFAPGFSTARMITDVSGRGVGMDVVRTNISELGGQVQVDSVAGRGTTLTLTVPLTLVTTRVLLVGVDNQIFGLPAAGCHGVIWVEPNQVRTIEGRAVLPRSSGIAPLLRLDELLGIAHARHIHNQRTPAILVGAASRPVAILIDQLIDEREVVVKPLGPLMERQRRYNGAFQLGDGRLALLLNPATLAQLTRGMALAVPSDQNQTEQRRQRLLVADDSFATRELIRSILTSAGYLVTTANDGADALEKLRLSSYDLVVSDVEMPRLDGFQLTSKIRTELGKTDLPVIIVTSLASETHRRRGLEAGAQAYIVKSQFNQSNLIETIRQLLGG